MAVPQANVQQRTDLSSYLAGNISQSVANRQRAGSDALGNVLDVAKTAYTIGSGVDQTIKAEDAKVAAGLETQLQQIGTKDGTQPFDAAYLRARMFANPDIAAKVAQLDRYKSTGRLTKPTDDKAPVGDVLGNLFRTGQLETSYSKIKGDEAIKTADFLNGLPDKSGTQTIGDYTKYPILQEFASHMGDTVDASERKVLKDLVDVLNNPNKDNEFARTYLADITGAAYLERKEDATGGTGADMLGGMQDASLQPGVEGTASKGGMVTQTGQPPLGSTGPGLLSNASSAASQAQGRMEPRGQVGATNRKPLILGMAPGMTTETVRQAQGSPQLQAAYAAAPQNLATYWGVKPEAVQAAYAGLSETGLPTDPAQRTQLMASWSKQIQTALPGIFPPTNTPEQTVKEALALRSGAAHTALASTLKGGQPVLPVDDKGQPILYVPNTGGAVQAPTAPTTTPDNKTAQTGGLTEVGFSTGIQTGQEPQGGVALGVDEGVLRSAEMKAAQGQPLTREETLARSNLHKVASAHVKVNGDVLVRGVPLKDLVRDYDQRLPEIENGIRKLNGMGLTVEDMMDPTLTSFQGYMNLLKPAQAAFVEKNKPIQDLINNIISFKQSEHAGQNIELAGKSLELQQKELAQRIDYQNKSLALEAKKIAADETASDPNNPGAANAKAYNLAYGNYVKAFTQFRQITKGVRQSEVDKQKADPNSPIGQLWNLMTLNYKVIGNGQPMPMEPPDPGGSTAPTTGSTAGNYSTPTTRPTTSLSGTGTATGNVDNFMSKYQTNR